MKKVIFIVLAIMSSMIAWSKNGFKVNVTIKDNTDSMVYLCYYYGNPKTVYRIDSARLTKGTANATFKRDTMMNSGMYLLLFADKATQFELFINNGDEYSVTFSKSNPIDEAKFIGSNENTEFYNYQLKAKELNKRNQDLVEALKKAKTKKDTTAIEIESRKLAKTLEDYRDNYVKNNPNTLLANVYNLIKEPSFSEEIWAMSDIKKRDSIRFRIYKDNFWNAVNFQDNRNIYMPLYENKLEAYFKLVEPRFDSLKKEIDFLLKKTEGTKDMYKYTFWWLSRYTGMSKIMGVDEAYAYMIENYIMRDKCPWIDDSTKKAYETDLKRISPNVALGKQAPEIELMDRNDKPAKLSSTVFANDYTIVAFYDPNCHHCQEEIPRIDSALRQIKKDLKFKVKVYAIQNAFDDEKWLKMITKDKLTDDLWVHVHDPSKMKLGTITSIYGIASNPVFFLLDSDGKIQGKRFDHSNMKGLFEFLEKRKKESK